MPVTGTPYPEIPPLPPGPGPIDPLYLAPLRYTHVYEHKIPTKRRAVVIKQGQTAGIQMNVLDDLGNPIDLEPYNLPLSYPSGQLLVRFVEAIGNNNCLAYAEQMGEVDDAATGLVSFPVPADLPQLAGVYICEVGVLDAQGRMFFSNTLFLVVDRGLFYAPNTPPPISQYAGPPNLDEIRLSMRDNGPEDNRLLDDHEFDAAELAWALIRSVQQWNVTYPPIDIYFNTITFPFRDLWIEGVCGQLFEMAGNRYVRNDLQYSAGGLTIADQSKWQAYYAIGERRWKGFCDTIRAKKVSVNMSMAMGSLGSPYSWFGA